MAVKRVISVAVGCALAVAIGVSVGAFAAHRQNSTGPPSGSPPSPSAPASPDSGADAHSVAAALAVLGTNPQSLVAAGAAPDVGGRAEQGVPMGSKVIPNERSWAPDGAGGGTIAVTVTPPGGAAVTYAAVMVREGGRWKVLATVPLAAAPAGVHS